MRLETLLVDSDGVEDAKLSRRQELTIARHASGENVHVRFHLRIASQLTSLSVVYPRWITIAHGRQTVFLTLPSHISYVLSSTPSFRWSILSTFFTLELLPFGKADICQA